VNHKPQQAFLLCAPFRVHGILFQSDGQIPLQCGLRLNPRFADNTVSLKDGYTVWKIKKVEG
jgi:hypothetical protein